MRPSEHTLARLQADLERDIEAADDLITRCHAALSALDRAPEMIDDALRTASPELLAALARVDPDEVPPLLARAWIEVTSPAPAPRPLRAKVQARVV